MSLINPAPYSPGKALQDGAQLNEEAALPALSVEYGIVATGNNVGSAYRLEAAVSVISGGGNGTGVRLPFPKPGLMVNVVNLSGSAKIIYPYRSDLINGGSSVTQAGATLQVLYCVGDWISIVVGTMDFSGLPTSPGAVGTLWNNGGVVCVA